MSQFFALMESMLDRMAADGNTAGCAKLRLRYILPLDRARTRG